MSLRLHFSSTALTLSLLGLGAPTLTACGSSSTALKYRVADKEVAGLTGDAALRVEAERGELRKLEDGLGLFEGETKAKKADIASAERQSDVAGDAIDAATDKIKATQGAEEKELDQAKARRDKQVSEIKQKYEEESRSIRDRYAQEQVGNRAALATAKGSKAVAAATQALHKAELAEAKARQAVQKQEIRVAQAQFEVTKLAEVTKLLAVTGPTELERKAKFDLQLAAEQKVLATKKADHEKKLQAVETAKGKLEQERARAGGN